MGNQLKRIRESKGMTHDDAAAAMSISRGQYIKLERGERRLNEDYILRASRAFGVPVQFVIADDEEWSSDGDAPQSVPDSAGFLPYAGTTQAGVFVDVELHANHEPQAVAISPDPRYRRARQYVWQVLGDSMNKAGIHDGMFAVGVDYVDFVEHYRPIETGDIVVVERMRFDGQERERTIKRYWEEPGGIALVPESTNPHHKPIVIPKDGIVEGEEIRIIAYVTGSYSLFGKAIFDLDEGQKIHL